MNTLLQKTFQNKYSPSSFEEFTAKLFQKSSGDFIHQKIFPNDFDEKHKNSQLLLSFETEDKKKIEVLSIELKTKSNVENARSYQRGLIERYINQNIENGKTVDGAFVAFWNTEESSWRLSFISLEVKDGKQIFSHPKRYSFVVGEGESTHTAKQQFDPIFEKNKTPLFSQLLEIFSVEKVTKDFYAEIQKSFFELVGAKIKKAKEEIIRTGVLTLPHKNPEKNHKDFQDFAVRLLGRIIFSWFLQKKKFSDGSLLISKKILSLDAVKNTIQKKENYYHTILEPLFFETLNKEKLARNKNLFPENLLDDFEKIPFLNGGLFQDQKGDTGDFYTTDAFAKLSAQHSPQIPNEWFEELFIVLERYNFTIDENSKLETEVSIDPEILGRIFENLLAEINPETGESARKSSGSFYTPREIVDYMVEESLMEFLESKFPKSQQKNISKETFLELSSQSKEEIHTFFNNFPTKNLNIDLSYFAKEKFSQCIFSPRLFLKLGGILQTKKGHNTAHKEIDENVWKNIVNEKITVIHKFFGKPKEVFLEGKNYFYPSVQIIFSFFDTPTQKNRFFTAFFTPLFSNKMQLNTLFEINEKRIKSYTKKYSSILEKMSNKFEISNENEEKAQGRTLTPPYEFTSEDETLGSSAYWSDQFSAVLQELFQSESILQKENLHVKFGGLTGLLQRVENIISGTGEVNEEKAKLKVLEALDTLKILDPACGSGAFPMGILQKVVHILEKIDPQNKIYLDQVVNQNPPEIRETVRKYLKSKDLNYVRKLGVIQKSIFGVDIQEMAIEISRLRFFLSLVVDEKPEDIQPLPNLDFKFVCANSLLSLPNITTGQSDLFADTQRKQIFEEMKKIREEYFSAHSDKKGFLQYQFSQCQKKLFKLVIETGGQGDSVIAEYSQKLQDWEPFENHSSDFFESEWMFGVKDGFNIVIGNPPYVQLQKNGGELAKMYANQKFESFAKTGDLYALFYERGNQLLTNGGNLCFITSNKWMRAGYGEKMRKYFIENTSPKLLIDLGPDVFETATVDTNILIFTKNISEKINCKACTIKEKLDKKDEVLKNYIAENSVQLPKLTTESWTILNPLEQQIKDKIEKIGTPLKDWDIKINYGIKTGYNEAFIISGEKKDELIQKDPKSAEIIKPILRGKDIKRYASDFADKFLIATLPAMKLNINNYSAIKEYLKSFGKRLEQTGKEYIDENGEKQKSRKKTCNKWFETQDQINYYEDFEKEKIVWNRIANEKTFSLVNKGVYIQDSMHFFTGKNLTFLNVILNSKVIHWNLKLIIGCSVGGNAGNADNIRILHIPKISETQQKPFIEKVDQILAITSAENYDPKNIPQEQKTLEKEIDKMVFDLYGLSEEERRVVLGE